MHPENENKVAFSISSGQYTWCVMPFGLRDAPAIFSQFIKLIIALYSRFLLYHLSYIFIYGDDAEQYIKNVMCILTALFKNKLTIESQKYWLFQERVEVLGYVTLKAGIEASSQKIDAVLDVLTTIKNSLRISQKFS